MNRPDPVHKVLRCSAVFLAVLLLTACASAPRDEGQVLIERAQERWDALIAGDLETAYGFFSPGYRSAHSLIDFGVSMRTRRVMWTSAEYVEHQCEEARCIVTFDVGFRVHHPVPGLKVYDSSEKQRETWIRTEGQWWYLPSK